MRVKTRGLTINIMTAIAILVGIEAAQGMEPEQTPVDNPLYRMVTTIPEAMLPYFSPEDRINIFSTCHDLNIYGIENYYREKNPPLKTIQWYQLEFSSTGALVRFNMLLLKMTKLFKSFCDFNDDANPQEYEAELAGNPKLSFHAMRNEGIPALSEKTESIEIQNTRRLTLKALSQNLIDKVDKAYSSGVLATCTGFTYFEDYSPLRYLLRWVRCYADDQVQVKYAYRVLYPSKQSPEEKNKLQIQHQTIQMTDDATYNLDQYCKIIRGYHNHPWGGLYNAEIGFHAYFFIDWSGLQERVARQQGDITFFGCHPNIDKFVSENNNSEKIKYKIVAFPLFCEHPAARLSGVNDLFLVPFYMHPHFYILLDDKITNDCFNQGHAYSILRLARFMNKKEIVKKITEHKRYDSQQDNDWFFLNLQNTNGSSQ